MIDANELSKRFRYHRPQSETTMVAHERVRDACWDAASAIVKLTPECREQSLAITALEEAMMWANAAIARNQHEHEVDPT